MTTALDCCTHPTTHTEPSLRPGDGGTWDEPVDTRATVVCDDCGSVLERLEPLPDAD